MLRKVGDVGLEGAETLAMPVIPVDKLGNVIMGGGGGGGASGGAAASYLSPGNFTAVWLAATQLTLTKLPFPPLQEQIVQVSEYDGDTLVDTYSQNDPAYDFTWAPGADSSTGTLTIAGAVMTTGNTFVVQIMGPQPDTLDVTTDLGGPYTHQGPRDFDIVFGTATTLVLGGVTAMAMSPDQADFKAVVEIAASGQIRMTYTRLEWAMTWAAGGAGTGTLTIAGATMQAGSTFLVFVDGPEHGIQRADAGGAIDQSVKRTQHQDATGGILASLSSLATAGFVKITDGVSEALLTAANLGRNATDIVLSTQHLGADGNPMPSGFNAAASLSTVLLGQLLAITGKGIAKSGIHFTAVQNAPTEIDLAGGFPAISSVGQFLGVAQISTAGVVTIFYPQTSVFTWDAVNDRLDIAAAVFAATDKFVVVIEGHDRDSSFAGNHLLAAEVNHFPTQGDSAPVDLIPGGAETFTAGWVDAGPEFSTLYMGLLEVLATFNINDSTGLQVRLVLKGESGGVEEFPASLETSGTSDVQIEPGYHELAVDADTLLPITYVLNGIMPVGQLQIKAGVLGGGTDATLDALAIIRSTFSGS